MWLNWLRQIDKTNIFDRHNRATCMFDNPVITELPIRYIGGFASICFALFMKNILAEISIENFCSDWTIFIRQSFFKVFGIFMPPRVSK